MGEVPFASKSAAGVGEHEAAAPSIAPALPLPTLSMISPCHSCLLLLVNYNTFGAILHWFMQLA